MLRGTQLRQRRRGYPTAPLGRPGAVDNGSSQPMRATGRQRSSAANHPLTRTDENTRLFDYERRVKSAFDAVVPTLKKVSALQHEADFVRRAQAIAREELGFELPEEVLEDAWVEQIDMRRLFAWCVFENYRRYCDDFYSQNPLMGIGERGFKDFLKSCGFHTMDISPCADGRLAHTISYVLRLPYKEVRRKSYAGAMFDIEDSVAKWTETEFIRLREAIAAESNDQRYLKTVVYHFSSVDPDHEGCAAHGSDTDRAAKAGLERLKAFQQAVENSFCCGASIDLLLIGLDTDTDAIRAHIPDANGDIDLNRFVEAEKLYSQTRQMNSAEAEKFIAEQIRSCNTVVSGMAKLISHLLINNLSQIDYVRQFHGQHYADAGHAERFVAAGIGFEEVQLRNLTYFAYMSTVEEATACMDVGVKIFSKLNVKHGLPIPIVVRYDYHGQVPGARERAIDHCKRVANAIGERYKALADAGKLHTLWVVRDCGNDDHIEVLGSTVENQPTLESDR